MLGLAIIGTAFGLLALFAGGMSNVTDDGRALTWFAFPLPAATFLGAMLLLIAARRDGRWPAAPAVAAALVSLGMLLLAIAALRSYS